MFNKGKIKSYDAMRGFGFIELDGNGQEVFFHIRDMPNADLAPQLGESLKFMVVEQDGKFKADNLLRLDHQCELIQPNSKPYTGITTPVDRIKASQRKLVWGICITCLLTIIIAVLGYQQYQRTQLVKQLKVQQLAELQKEIIAQQRAALGDKVSDEIIVKEKRIEAEATKPAATVTPVSVSPVVASAQTQFRCDGRTHCSQMRSYEEAVFFLKNCPGTQMDGNNDGEPCERQFGR